MQMALLSDAARPGGILAACRTLELAERLDVPQSRGDLRRRKDGVDAFCAYGLLIEAWAWSARLGVGTVWTPHVVGDWTVFSCPPKIQQRCLEHFHLQQVIANVMRWNDDGATFFGVARRIREACQLPKAPRVA